MPEPIELTTIRNLANELETALQGVDRKLVHYLNRQGFIGDDECDDVFLNPRSTLRESEKAGELVKAIKKRVKQEPRDYHSLVNHLKEGGSRFQPIVEKLDKEFARLEGTEYM